MAELRRILSVDGGGIRGVIAARILHEIEVRKGKPLAEIFDLIAGTSAGGIIACGLARPGKPMGAQELLNLYVTRGAEIFHRSLWRVVVTMGGVIDEKYSTEPKLQILAEVLGDSKLSEVSQTKLLVSSYAIELPPAAKSLAVPDSTRAPFFFKSWNVDDPSRPLDPKWDYHLRDVARATSAAPTYFEPAVIYSLAGERGAMVDGGVVANNPAMCAYAEAMRLWPGCDHVVVSVGTGQLERRIPFWKAKHWGLVQWAHPVLSVLMDGSSDTVSYELRRILGSKHSRFDISLGTSRDSRAASDDLDNATPENIQLLLGRAQMLLDQPETVAAIEALP
jgi:predicted acylesterase/phospholipase RssA